MSMYQFPSVELLFTLLISSFANSSKIARWRSFNVPPNKKEKKNTNKIIAFPLANLSELNQVNTTTSNALHVKYTMYTRWLHP